MESVLTRRHQARSNASREVAEGDCEATHQRPRDAEVGDAARWPRVRLGDVSEVVLGGTPRTAVDAYWDGSIPWLTPGEMGKILGPYVEDTKRKLSEEGLKAGSSLFPSRSVILSTRAPIGYVFINRVPMCTNQGCKTLVPSSEVWPEYLYFNLLGRTDELNQLGTGTTFKELATGALKGIEFPLPPLPVQREIVARLERELGAVDKLAKKFEDLEAAAEAEFKAELKETFEEIKHRGEMHRRSSASKGRFGEAEPEGRVSVCETRRLGDVCEVVCGKTPLRSNPRFWEGGDVPWFTIDDLREQGNEIRTTAKHITDEAVTLMRVVPSNTVLLCCTASIGACCITRIPLTTNQQFNALIVRSADLLTAEFLYYFCLGLTPVLMELSSRTTIDFVSKTKVENIEISIPPLPAQREVVARLDAAKAKKEKLVAAARRGRETVALMRKAILKEAFE